MLITFKLFTLEITQTMATLLAFPDLNLGLLLGKLSSVPL
jgi:hypothetical protein